MNTSHIEPALPELSEARIDEIETAVFSEIAKDRTAQQAKRTRRTRVGVAGGAAAAVVALAALISPAVGGMIAATGQSGADSAVLVAPASDGGAPFELGAITGESGAVVSEAHEALDAASLGDARTSPQDDAAREVITTASASVVVDDPATGARAIGDAAVVRGGYVESMNVGTSGSPTMVDPRTGLVYDTYPPAPIDGAWITVRVPSTELTGLVDELAEVGEVTASTVDRRDVTEQSVDLAARIDAARASVARLTDLMAQAGDLSDLIAAESALAERQSELESLEQQLEMLQDQVAMSSLSVTLSPVPAVVEADPAGFVDGLAVGWNGLVATLNGIVVALGFLLPWLAVAAVAAVVVWGIVRLVKRSRRTPTDPGNPAS